MLKQLFVPAARLSRLEYWRGLAILGTSAQLILVVSAFAINIVEPPAATTRIAFYTGVALAGWIVAALSAQRLHDREANGVWAVLPAALVILAGGSADAAFSSPDDDSSMAGGLWALVMISLAFALLANVLWNGVWAGTATPNRFGASRRRKSLADVFDSGHGVPAPRIPIVSTIVALAAFLVVSLLNGIVLYRA